MYDEDIRVNYIELGLVNVNDFRLPGPAAAGDLLANCRGDVLQEKTESAAHIRKTVFNRFFTLLHTGRLIKHENYIANEEKLLYLS